MQRPLSFTAGLCWLMSCTLDAPVVREESNTSVAGMAGALGGAATGGLLSPSFDRDWCVAPAFDAIGLPDAGSCRDDTTDHVVYSIRERVTYSALAIAFDRSTSMQKPLSPGGESKWQGVIDAIQLLTDHEPTGYLSGISWVPFPSSDGADPLTQCDARDYRVYTNFPQSAATINNGAIMSAIEADPPNLGLRPTATLRTTGPGVLAALQEARRMASEDRSHVVSPLVVVISDGTPSGCGDWDVLANLSVVLQETNPWASDGFAPIHVIQLGTDVDLKPLAVAGGSVEPHVISRGPIGRQLAEIIRRILYPLTDQCSIPLDLRWSNPGLRAPSRFAMRIESPYTKTATSPAFLPDSTSCGHSPAGGFWVRELEPMNYVVELCPCTCGARQIFHTLQLYGFCD